MGVTHSTPKAKPKILPPDGNSPDALPAPILSDVDPQQTLQYDLCLLLKSVDSIPRSNSGKTISVFGQFAVPVVTSVLKFEEDPDLKIKFAKIAISRHELGRIIVFRHISTITSCVPGNNKHTLFLQKTLRWIGGPHPSTRMLCLYKIDAQYRRQLKTNLEGLGFGIDIQDNIENVLAYTIIFVQSNCESDPRFIDFLNAGGGLFVVGVDDSNLKINPTLQQVGISFLPRYIEYEDSEVMEDVNPKESFESLEKAKIEEHITQYRKLIQNGFEFDKKFKFLSDIIMEEVMSSALYSNKNICDLADLLLPALLNVLQNDGWVYGSTQLCESLIRMCTILFPQIPLPFWGAYDFSSRFIGSSQNAECDGVNVNCTFSSPVGWYDTGVWLQPGFVSTISFDKRLPDCNIIIGMHTFDCTHNKPPWKRFPFVISKMHITDRTMNVATPYGGMVFFEPCESEFANGTKPSSFRVNFSDACHFPEASINSPDLWKNTYTDELPWGEMITKFAYFIAQTEIINNIDDQMEQMKFLDKCINAVISFSNFNFVTKFRFVFDVEFPQTLMLTYPITLDSSLCTKILMTRQPSEQIFAFLTILAYNTFLDEGLTHDLHSSLAATIASLSMMSVFRVKDIKQYNTYPKLKGVTELANLAIKNKECFSTALNELRQAQKQGKTDVNLIFLSIVKEKGGIDLTTQFDIIDEVSSYSSVIPTLPE